MKAQSSRATTRGNTVCELSIPADLEKRLDRKSDAHHVPRPAGRVSGRFHSVFTQTSSSCNQAGLRAGHQLRRADMDGCWSFTSLQHLRSCQGGYRLMVTLQSVPLGNHAAGTMTLYPTQSHYPSTVLTSPCPILLMLRTSLRSQKNQLFFISYWFDSTKPQALPI